MDDVTDTQDIGDEHAYQQQIKECIDKVFTFAAQSEVSNTAHSTVVFSFSTRFCQ
ncbi:hypothetical protein VCRLGP107_700287 [Vibrio crassostreae]|nr:hypothetical protein VCRLGP107_700287 [Vibrio crassostreae]